MLTIAHRLNTVINCDKMIVMGAGTIKEMGSPSELLAKEGGRLSNMVSSLGEATATRLKEEAAAAGRRKQRQEEGGVERKKDQ